MLEWANRKGVENLPDPDYQRKGIGRELMARLMRRYEGFHQHAVLADTNAVPFYEHCGFERSVCTAMWIYDGDDH